MKPEAFNGLHGNIVLICSVCNKRHRPRCIGFEDFLRDKHSDHYMGVDDDMPDAFDKWLTDDLQADDLIQLAEEWVKTLIK